MLYKLLKSLWGRKSQPMLSSRLGPSGPEKIFQSVQIGDKKGIEIALCTDIFYKGPTKLPCSYRGRCDWYIKMPQLLKKCTSPLDPDVMLRVKVTGFEL